MAKIGLRLELAEISSNSEQRSRASSGAKSKRDEKVPLLNYPCHMEGNRYFGITPTYLDKIFMTAAAAAAAAVVVVADVVCCYCC